MPPQFLYFDLGNVLLYFSHQRMAEQTARVAGIPTSLAWQILFEDGLQWELERGEISEDQFYTRFAERTGSSPERAALDHAANDIFDLNVSVIALVGRIAAAGHRFGILSNTTPSHWRHCLARYTVLEMFPALALSYELGAMKPDPKIFTAAADLVGVSPEHIFFTDDRADHVTAARQAGWDAIVYESASQINQHLRSRGLTINY